MEGLERIVGKVNELVFKISDEEITSGIRNWLNEFLEKYSSELQRYTGGRNEKEIFGYFVEEGEKVIMEIVKKYNAEGIHERSERLGEILKNGFLKFILGLNHAIEREGLKVDEKDKRKLMWAAGLIIYIIREVIESNEEDPSWVYT